MSKGFVYVLSSPNSDFVKIGGTERPIAERLAEINSGDAFKDQGPWEISDFLHVTDWRLVERGIHQAFRRERVDHAGTRELFQVPLHQARNRLRQVEPEFRVTHEKTQIVFRHLELKLFLHRLFQITGLFGSLDLQGAWTLTILPPTAGGRWYTLNIGSHEVAFSSRRPLDHRFEHFLVLDRLVLEYPDTVMWIGKRDGKIRDAHYKTARERAVVISFWEDLAGAEKIFTLPGIRRGLAAYWSDRLAYLRQRNVKSPYERYHSYDAVSELLEYKYAADRMIYGFADEPPKRGARRMENS